MDQTPIHLSDHSDPPRSVNESADIPAIWEAALWVIISTSRSGSDLRSWPAIEERQGKMHDIEARERGSNEKQVNSKLTWRPSATIGSLKFLKM
jgi:hypothetical protein